MCNNHSRQNQPSSLFPLPSFNRKYPITFIVGATATGKSEVAFLLAQKFKAEIVSADAMLVYNGPKIITSRPPDHMLKAVKHHFVGAVPLNTCYSVFEYFESALKTIAGLTAENIPVVVCGGSGLYVKAILDGIFDGPGKSELLREKLSAQAQNNGSDYLYNRLREVDPAAAKKISSNDLRRIIRALEVHSLTGRPLSEVQSEAVGLWGKQPIKIFGLRLKRDNLYRRINQRVDAMFEQGAIEEVKELSAAELSLTAKKILGIGEIQRFLSGTLSRDDAGELLKKNTRNFAKRQITWFKRDRRIRWIDVDDLSAEEAASTIDKILNSKH